MDRERALQLKIPDLSAPVLDDKTIYDGVRKIAQSETTLYEWKANRLSDGALFDIEIGLRHMKRRGSNVMLAAVRDISDRKKAEAALRESLEEKIILIKEIHHRVKNNMQVISSLLNMQADTVYEPLANQALKDAIGRIHSMASIHEKIYSTESFSRVDMAAYIDELSKDLLNLHSGRKGSITIQSQLNPVYLGMDKAIPCGLLINEILTNSIKHGSCETNPCAIDLRMDESDGWISLIIADNGPGMEPELFRSEQKTSMGMQIIEALARQINATLSLDVDRGTRFTIRIPSDS
jgi:two-component system, sensor histidine kinase PdtaS